MSPNFFLFALLTAVPTTQSGLQKKSHFAPELKQCAFAPVM